MIQLRTERSGVRISPGAPLKSKGYIFLGVALCCLGSTMGSNSGSKRSSAQCRRLIHGAMIQVATFANHAEPRLIAPHVLVGLPRSTESSLGVGIGRHHITDTTKLDQMGIRSLLFRLTTRHLSRSPSSSLVQAAPAPRRAAAVPSRVPGRFRTCL